MRERPKQGSIADSYQSPVRETPKKDAFVTTQKPKPNKSEVLPGAFAKQLKSNQTADKKMIRNLNLANIAKSVISMRPEQ